MEPSSVEDAASAQVLTTCLRQLQAAAAGQADLPALLHEVLRASMTLLSADKGTLQLSDEAGLSVVAHMGFHSDFLEHFRLVSHHACACGLAFVRRQRVIIADVFTDGRFREIAPLFAAEGLSAVQSTPLLDSLGQPFGVVSTHFRNPHVPDVDELRLLDLYLTQASNAIEARRTHTGQVRA
jgi:GAF domain-containing protein